MGSNKPLLRTYSCHLASLRSGGVRRGVRRDGAFGSCLAAASPESLLESAEALGDTLDTIDSGRLLESFRSLFRGLVRVGLSSAGDMAEEGLPRGAPYLLYDPEEEDRLEVDLLW